FEVLSSCQPQFWGYRLSMASLSPSARAIRHCSLAGQDMPSASLIVLPLAYWSHGKNLFPDAQRFTHIVRTAFLVTAMTLYFLAISKIPIVLAISAYFVGPVIAVALSVMFLKEALTARKLVSLGLGLIGSLVVLQPAGAIEAGLIMAFGAGLFFAL
ncbi:unnamed protein product, partial [Ectocarpus sp. 12 AP-2014]